MNRSTATARGGAATALLYLLLTLAARVEGQGLIQVRKSFDGSKKESEPAVLTYVDSDTKGAFYQIDFGVKVKGLGNFEESSGTEDGEGTDDMEEPSVAWALYPTFELHRSSSTSEPVNKKSAAVNLEVFQSNLRLFDASGDPLPARLQPEGGGRTAVPVVLSKIKVTRDSENDATVSSWSLAATLFSNKRHLPGAITTNLHSKPRANPIYRYYPYLGVEYIDNLPVKLGDEVIADEISETFAFARLYLEWYPLNRWVRGKVQVLGAYTYRVALGNDEELDGSLGFLSVGVNYFLDAEGKVSVGWLHEEGKDPKLNFAKEEVSSVAFRVLVN